MHQEFWLERWQQNQIGFHNEEINPYLQQYWPIFNANGPVFVPLCGKSNDMLWLLAQGYDVIGVELSALAIDAFFTENALSATTTQRGKFTVSQSEGVQLYCGNFFDLTPDDIAGIGAVYDRASLVALPPKMRTAYVGHMRYLLSIGIPTLLIAFDYAQNEMQGPPFSVQVPEVEALYRDWCDVSLLSTEDILDYEPRFRDKGLTRLQECAYSLTVK